MKPETIIEPHAVAVIERIAWSQPDEVAVIDDTARLTYSELLSSVESWARHLRAAGLRQGDRVALVAENSAHYLVAALAVWKAEGVLATIYPSSGAADLEYSIRSSDPVLVLVDARTADAVKTAYPDAPTARIDEDFHVSQVRTGAKPNPPVREPLSLICYTSGTTSRPKAIMLSTIAVFNGAETYAQVWHLSPADKTVVALPMAWLYGLDTSALATLFRGGTVIVLRRARPELLVEAIETHGATFLPGVTTMFTKLVDYLQRAQGTPNLSSLRLCVSGGEPRNEVAFDAWKQFSGCPVHDTFCASECFPLVTYDPIADPEPVPGSAGKVVPRSSLRIVNADGEDVPVGQVGEALSRGAGLMLGYWRDEELTNAVLTADGWYRTKDLVRMDEDGYVYVVGRLSDMILRGGANVSPAEVETVLRQNPAVRDVAVVGLPDDMYGQRVVAAVVLQHPHSLDQADLADRAGKQLASYKVPTHFVVLDELPQNPTTGKVDRRLVASIVTERVE